MEWPVYKNKWLDHSLAVRKFLGSNLVRTSPVHPVVKVYSISDSAQYCQNDSLWESNRQPDCIFPKKMVTDWYLVYQGNNECQSALSYVEKHYINALHYIILLIINRVHVLTVAPETAWTRFEYEKRLIMALFGSDILSL